MEDQGNCAFCSVLRDDFRPDSDVDVLVTFEEGVALKLRDYDVIESELSAIVGRKVDFVERPLVEKNPNYIIRSAILKSLEPLDVS